MRTTLSRWQLGLADGLDRLTLAVSPKRAYLRRVNRFACGQGDHVSHGG